ncbi:MAG: site-specific DNA-methyltransferase [Methanoregulaceae archaeon]|nr:site-specific DNA-methyltransferase [Methanoregulaceae archaeon]
MPRQLKGEQIKPSQGTVAGHRGISRSGAAGPLIGTSDFLPGDVIPDEVQVGKLTVRRYSAELWTSAQRKASSIHEISYRACFKPQLAAFFIERFTEEGDLVYDPFGGRGTTIIEAGLLGRRVVQNDINPLTKILTKPRFFVPSGEAVRDRLSIVPRDYDQSPPIDLSMFYHPSTEKEILAMREFLSVNQKQGEDDEDDVNAWIRMVATNRLTGHSSGFFSVYTLPPNQAVSPGAQEKINIKRQQVPPYRDTHEIIMKKTRTLTRNLTVNKREKLHKAGSSGLFLTGDAASTPEIRDNSVQLTVTSPPFLNIVQYSKDNWLRCWFNEIDDIAIGKKITMTHSLDVWVSMISRVFQELFRITRPGGWVAFEVGEVKKGTLHLDEHVIPAGITAGFRCECILVNQQEFTKTSNIWGIGNNNSGTNTNRIVLFRKDDEGQSSSQY